jgi:hypothetical protein
MGGGSGRRRSNAQREATGQNYIVGKTTSHARPSQQTNVATCNFFSNLVTLNVSYITQLREVELSDMVYWLTCFRVDIFLPGPEFDSLHVNFRSASSS